MLKVSVETGLDGIKAYLSTCGYDVVDIANCVHPVQAVVYSGPPLPKPLKRKADGDVTFFVNVTNLTKEEVVESLQAPFS